MKVPSIVHNQEANAREDMLAIERALIQKGLARRDINGTFICLDARHPLYPEWRKARDRYAANINSKD